jgi:hypothetical protein
MCTIAVHVAIFFCWARHRICDSLHLRKILRVVDQYFHLAVVPDFHFDVNKHFCLAVHQHLYPVVDPLFSMNIFSF